MSKSAKQELSAAIHRKPGIHFNGLVRELDIAPEQAKRFLSEHLDQGTLVRQGLYGQQHYYPPRFSEHEQAILALLRRETAREIILHLFEHGESSPVDIADSVGIARSTLSWHLDRLIEQEIVEKRHEKGRSWLSLTDPGRIEPLLAEVRPLLPERLLDRAERLIDIIFEDSPF